MIDRYRRGLGLFLLVLLAAALCLVAAPDRASGSYYYPSYYPQTSYYLTQPSTYVAPYSSAYPAPAQAQAPCHQNSTSSDLQLLKELLVRQLLNQQPAVQPPQLQAQPPPSAQLTPQEIQLFRQLLQKLSQEK